MGRYNNKRTQAAAVAMKNTPARARFSKGPPPSTTTKSSSSTNKSNKSSGRGGGGGSNGGSGRGNEPSVGGRAGRLGGGSGGNLEATARVIGRIQDRVVSTTKTTKSSSINNNSSNNQSSRMASMAEILEYDGLGVDKAKWDTIVLPVQTQELIAKLLQDLGIIMDEDDDDNNESSKKKQRNQQQNQQLLNSTITQDGVIDNKIDDTKTTKGRSTDKQSMVPDMMTMQHDDDTDDVNDNDVVLKERSEARGVVHHRDMMEEVNDNYYYDGQYDEGELLDNHYYYDDDDDINNNSHKNTPDRIGWTSAINRNLIQNTNAITFHVDSDDDDHDDRDYGSYDDDDEDDYYSNDCNDDDEDNDDDGNNKSEHNNDKNEGKSDDGHESAVAKDDDDNLFDENDPTFIHLTQHLSFSHDQVMRACKAIDGWEGLSGTMDDIEDDVGGNKEKSSNTNKLLELAMDWLCLHLSEGELSNGFRPNANRSRPVGRRQPQQLSGRKTTPITAVPHPSISVWTKFEQQDNDDVDDQLVLRSIRFQERAVALVRLGFHHSDAVEACSNDKTDGSTEVPSEPTIPEEDPALPILLLKLKREALASADDGNDNVSTNTDLLHSNLHLDLDALREEREQELEALQAIYDDQIHVVSVQEGEKINGRYVIAITPTQDLQEPARSGDCKLHIYLTPGYPTVETPLFLFCNPSLPPTLLRQINIVIHQKAQELLGVPVIFDVVSFLADVLPEMHMEFIKEQRRKEFDAEQVRLSKHRQQQQKQLGPYSNDDADPYDDKKLGRRQRAKLRAAEKAYNRPDEMERWQQEYRRRQDVRVDEAREQNTRIRATYAQAAIAKRQREAIEEEAEKAARAAMSRAFNRGASVDEARAEAEEARRQSLIHNGVGLEDDGNTVEQKPNEEDDKSNGKDAVADEIDQPTSKLEQPARSSQFIEQTQGSPATAAIPAPATRPTQNTAVFMDRLREMYNKAAREKTNPGGGDGGEKGPRNPLRELDGYHLGGPSQETSQSLEPTGQRVPRPVACPAGEMVDMMKDIISQQEEQPWLISQEARAPTTSLRRAIVSPAEQRREKEISERLQNDLKRKRKEAAAWGEKNEGGEHGQNFRQGNGFSPQRFHYMMAARQRLPAYKMEHEIVQTIRDCQVTVIAGETGCGKTTQVPQLVLDDLIIRGQGATANIVVTQPRRISAIGVSERIAEERCEKVGETCGYSIKLEKKMSSRTRLLLCTTGVLLRRLQCDPDLAAVSHIFVDEVHERDLNTDFLIIILKDLLARRKDLKLVLMSATLNAESFSSFFGVCPVVSIPGRAHPVKENRLEDILELTGYKVLEGSDYALKSKAAMSPKISKSALRSLYYPKYSKDTIHSLSIVDETVINYELLADLLEHISLNEGDGAILVFCPGLQEIQKTIEELYKKEYFQSSKVMIYPLHSTLSTAEQTAIFQIPPPDVRKIVVSTNIAETSITIEDVVYVVDTGRVKENRRDEINETPTLVECWVSRASAKQRRGRAGRVRPGIAYHMFSSHTHDNELQEYQVPEMLRVGIEDLVLQILILDLGEPTTFLKKALDPPSNLAMSNSLKLLEQLGAVECQWHPQSGGLRSSIADGWDVNELQVSSELTALGFHLATLPVDPRVGKMMIYGALFGCVDPLLTLASAMSARSPFVSPFDQREQADMARKKFAIEGSDHLTILNAFEQWSDLRRTTSAQGNRVVNSFLKENFLGRLTLLQMEDLRRQFHSLLTDIGFLPRGFHLKELDHAANINCQNRGLVKAILCAGLYPNIIVAPREVVASSQGSINNNNGVGKNKGVVGEHPFRSHRKGDLYLHPSTVAFDEPKLDSRYCCYHELVRTSKTYVRDCTTVSPLALLLFGGTLETYPTHGVCAVDGWLKFRIQAKSATLIKYLRSKMERLLFEKIVSPHKDVIETGDGQAVIRSISLLFETELLNQRQSSATASATPVPDRSGGEIVRPWNGNENENKAHRRVNAGHSGGRHGRGRGRSQHGRGRGGSRGGQTGRGRGSITG